MHVTARQPRRSRPHGAGGKSEESNRSIGRLLSCLRILVAAAAVVVDVACPVCRLVRVRLHGLASSFEAWASTARRNSPQFAVRPLAAWQCMSTYGVAGVALVSWWACRGLARTITYERSNEREEIERIEEIENEPDETVQRSIQVAIGSKSIFDTVLDLGCLSFRKAHPEGTVNRNYASLKLELGHTDQRRTIRGPHTATINDRKVTAHNSVRLSHFILSFPTGHCSISPIYVHSRSLSHCATPPTTRRASHRTFFFGPFPSHRTTQPRHHAHQPHRACAAGVAER